MNLFILSKNPREAAQAHGDKHVIKMLLEACQMLYCAHWIAVYPNLLEHKSAIRISQAQKELSVPEHMQTAPTRKGTAEIGFRPVHLHHPCTKWVRACAGNYLWAVELALALAAEYEYRFGPNKEHCCRQHAIWLACHLPPGISRRERVDFAVAMDDMYKVSEDPVENYINYYRTSKQERGLTTYTRREPPPYICPKVVHEKADVAGSSGSPR